MKKKYRIYRDPNKTWWVDSIIPGLDTLWVSDYRIRRSGLTLFSGPWYMVERWVNERDMWAMMGPAKTWLDAISMIAYRERQLQSSEDQVHHLEACS